MHRAILAVDVERFTDPRRINPDQAVVRDAVYAALRWAFDRCGVPWDGVYHEDRGDGLLGLVTPEVPKNLLVTALPRYLAEALARHNEGRPAEVRVRLRVALHAGEVLLDAHGVAATAVNDAFRLLEAQPLKDALAASPGVLALIVSDWFYTEVVRNDPDAGAATYRRVRTTVKRSVVSGWLGLPDHPYPPDEQRDAPEPDGPRQLPARASRFVGRTRELATLLDLVAAGGDEVPVLLVTGTAGVGKTALAVALAHRVRDLFPDGHLYADLRGYDGGPALTPERVLGDLLTALGVPVERVPCGVAAQAALFRSTVDGKRVLLVLDNAAGAEQVRPLLPGSPGCLVLVTSRNRLSGLVAREGAHRVALGSLSGAEAVELLRLVVGPERVDAEPAAAARLAEQCAHLPLALRIAAERVATRPHLHLADVVAEIGRDRDRLDLLAADDDGDTEIRAVFSWSYRALPEPAARVFRLLGLHAGATFDVRAAAALADVEPAAARRLLDALASVHLLDETARDRYRLHDLLRVYAAERAAAVDGDTECADAVRRTLAWYLRGADAADSLLLPMRPYSVDLGPFAEVGGVMAFTGYDEALAWCEAERANLLAAAQQAAEHGYHQAAWAFGAATSAYFDLRKHWNDRIAVLLIGLASAERAGDGRGEAFMLLNLGVAYRDLRDFDRALECLDRALVLSRELGDRWTEGGVLHKLGDTHRRTRRFTEALDFLGHALALARDVGEEWGEGRVLNSLGDTCVDLGRYEEALDHYAGALAIWRRRGTDWGEGVTLTALGDTHRRLGRCDEALHCLEGALLIARKVGNRHGEAETLRTSGDVHHDLGDEATARALWHEALLIFDDLGDPQAEHLRARVPG
ncbi:ATP-binding protein [Saccharothrix syringae]|uniref:Tetratricopeptide repeat protein n=1 Tax=Saccharothrix syringae TaxID=103733 RepID=A0A5Q0H0I3_SACSY|nr:tetratricopeptide repeat protein [Saccharothrix syringae]QFZ19747.1 tetratricopeptide repeat protein [Saccharothrix syringae]